MRETLKVSRYAWAHDFFFSLNLAWIAIRFEQARPQSFMYRFALSGPKRSWYGITDKPYGVVEYIFWSITIAAALFLFLRLLRLFWVPGDTFSIFSGIIAIGGFPGTVLYFVPFSLVYSLVVIRWRHPLAFLTLLCCELAGALLYGALHFMRKGRSSTITSITLAAGHFVLWALITGIWVNPLADVASYGSGNAPVTVARVFYLSFPAIGFLASITWGAYVRRGLQPQSAAGGTVVA